MRPCSISSAIAPFRASQQPPGCYYNPHLSCGNLAPGSLEVYDIPGYLSENLLTDEISVQSLTELLQNSLNKAQVEK